jgi:hypothetical protein
MSGSFALRLQSQLTARRRDVIALLYLGSSRCARPLPSRSNRPCRSPRSLHSLTRSTARLKPQLAASCGYVIAFLKAESGNHTVLSQNRLKLFLSLTRGA